MNLLTNEKDRDWNKLVLPENRVNILPFLDTSLFKPLESFFQTPGKNIRSYFVELGFLLGKENEYEITADDRERLNLVCEIVETIHAGALIVDDIQDDSKLRRNSETLHLKFGLPKALNAGNWLYFYGLDQIKKLNLDPLIRAEVLHDCLDLMIKAHYGQAIDVGTRIDEVPQESIPDLCAASHELKTGTLMCLAMRLGASLTKEGNQTIKSHYDLGIRLGITLQIFDDVGNYLHPKIAGPSKRREDLQLLRASWVWSRAARRPIEKYQQFLLAVKDLPNEDSLSKWDDENEFSIDLLQSAKKYLNETISFSQSSVGQKLEVMNIIYKVGSILEQAYAH